MYNFMTICILTHCILSRSPYLEELFRLFVRNTYINVYLLSELSTKNAINFIRGEGQGRLKEVEDEKIKERGGYWWKGQKWPGISISNVPAFFFGNLKIGS